MSALSSTTRIRGSIGVVAAAQRRPLAAAVLGPVGGLGEEALGHRGDRRGADLARLGDLLGRQVRSPERDAQREGAALARGAGHRGRAAVQGDQLGDQRQPDAGALVAARPGAADPVEPLEQVRQLGRRRCRCPVSATSSSAPSGRADSRTVTPPSKVNFSAFDSRLRTTLAHRSRSTYTGSGSGGAVDVRLRPSRPAAVSNMPASSRV